MLLNYTHFSKNPQNWSWVRIGEKYVIVALGNLAITIKNLFEGSPLRRMKGCLDVMDVDL